VTGAEAYDALVRLIDSQDRVLPATFSRRLLAWAEAVNALPPEEVAALRQRRMELESARISGARSRAGKAGAARRWKGKKP
jgi:hypothetical protein